MLKENKMIGLDDVYARDTVKFIELLAEGLGPERILEKFEKESHVYGCKARSDADIRDHLGYK